MKERERNRKVYSQVCEFFLLFGMAKLKMKQFIEIERRKEVFFR